MHKKSFPFIIIISILAACSAGGAEGAHKKTVRVAYLPITHSLAVMLMEDVASADADYKVELHRFTSWQEIVEALRTKRVDGASVLFEVALRARETDRELRLHSLSHRGGNVIVVANGIESYRDLIGRNVAIPHRLSPQHTLLKSVLEREGIAPSEINIIELSPAEMPFSMASGSISAYVVAEPWGTVAESNGAGRIIEASGGVCCVLAFNEGVFEGEPLLEAKLLEWFNAAAEVADEKGERAVECLKYHSSFSETVIRESIHKTDYSELALSKEEYDRVTAAALKYDTLRYIPPYEGFVLGGAYD